MKKRVAYFIIDGKQFGDEKNSPLNISFNVSYMGNSLVPLDANFTIDNLSQDNIAYISTNTSLFLTRRRKIQFFCGYEGNVQLLFDGEIEQAQPHGQPDTSLEIRAWTSIYSMGKKIKVKFNNIKAIDLLKSAIKECGYSLSCPAEIQTAPQLQKIIEYFSMTGSAQEFLWRVIRNITGNYVVKDQVLFTIAKGVVSVAWADKINSKKKFQKIYSINGEVIGKYLDTGNLQINESTGMIGIPEPTQAGINLRTKLDVSLGVGQTIDFFSLMMPIYNGSYNIYGITHHGSTRGKDFYTDLICLMPKVQ